MPHIKPQTHKQRIVTEERLVTVNRKTDGGGAA